MKRVRVATLPCEGPLDASVSHHLVHVLRAKPGRELVLFDGAGAEQPAEICEIREGIAHVQPTGPVRQVSPAPPIDLVVAVLKHQAMDLAIRMATEAGVSGIHPVLTDRTIARGDRSDRWLRIATSAAAQCGRAAEPTIHPVLPLRSAIEQLDCPVFTGFPNAPMHRRATSACAVCVGPAGGFSPAEAAWLGEVTQPISLGPYVLRAETACAVAVALLAAPIDSPHR